MTSMASMYPGLRVATLGLAAAVLAPGLVAPEEGAAQLVQEFFGSGDPPNTPTVLEWVRGSVRGEGTTPDSWLHIRFHFDRGRATFDRLADSFEGTEPTVPYANPGDERAARRRTEALPACRAAAHDTRSLPTHIGFVARLTIDYSPDGGGAPTVWVDCELRVIDRVPEGDYSDTNYRDWLLDQLSALPDNHPLNVFVKALFLP